MKKKKGATFTFTIGRGKNLREMSTWLLEFSRIDLKTLRLGEMLDLYADVWAFPTWEIMTPIGTSPEVSEKAVTKYEGEIRQIQSDIKTGLRLLADRRTWTLPAIPSQCRVVHTPDPSGLAKLYSGSLREMFVSASVDLLQEMWPQVRHCGNPDCQNLFLPIRRQAYCSSKCSQQVRLTRFRKKHPDSKRDYKEEYHRRILRKSEGRTKANR